MPEGLDRASSGSAVAFPNHRHLVITDLEQESWRIARVRRGSADLVRADGTVRSSLTTPPLPRGLVISARAPSRHHRQRDGRFERRCRSGFPGPWVPKRIPPGGDSPDVPRRSEQDRPKGSRASSEPRELRSAGQGSADQARTGGQFDPDRPDRSVAFADHLPRHRPVYGARHTGLARRRGWTRFPRIIQPEKSDSVTVGERCVSQAFSGAHLLPGGVASPVIGTRRTCFT